MDFQTSVQTCFKKYATFSGRASRSEFWYFALFTLIAGFVTAIIDTMIFGYTVEDYGPLNTILNVVVFIPSLAVGARRLHDTNKSGWWQLIYLTIIGIILLIVWWATMGDTKKNMHGSPITKKTRI